MGSLKRRRRRRIGPDRGVGLGPAGRGVPGARPRAGVRGSVGTLGGSFWDAGRILRGSWPEPGGNLPGRWPGPGGTIWGRFEGGLAGKPGQTAPATPARAPSLALGEPAGGERWPDPFGTLAGTFGNAGRNLRGRFEADSTAVRGRWGGGRWFPRRSPRRRGGGRKRCRPVIRRGTRG